MATRDKDKVIISWLELSEVLSKAGILLPDEDITQLTLTRPRTLLIHTFRPLKRTKE